MTQRTYQTTLLIRGDARNAVRQVSLTRQELEKLTGAQGSSATRTQKMGQAFLNANASVGRLTGGLQGLGGLLGTLGIAAFTRKALDSADSLANMRGQLKLVTDSQEELNQVYNRALALSNATGQATEATVNLYARMARSTEELNLTQDQLFKITQAVNQSFVVSGATATEAGSATLQLSQGLAAGALRGEELNSVMENSPRLARALADGLGVPIGRLREMGKEGELTAERVTTALLASAEGIEGEFAQMPMTIGRAMQSLTNSVNDALGDIDTTQLSSAVAEAQRIIADPSFKQAVGDLATGMVTLLSNTAGALAELAKFSKFVGEELARRVSGAAYDDIAGMEAELARLETRLSGMRVGATRNASAAEKLRNRIQELSEWIAIARKEAELDASVKKKQAEATGTLAREQGAAAIAAKSLANETADLAAVGFDAAGSMLNIAEASKLAGAAAESASSGGAEALKKLGKEADPVAAAIERTGERMDDAFAGFFRNMLRDGEVSFDSLKNLALDSLGEIIYAFARNKVLVGVGAAGSFGSAAASAAGSVGSTLSGGVPAILSALGGGVTNVLQGAAGFSSNLGFGAGARFFTGLENNFAQAGELLGGGVGAGALGNLGAGLVGNFLGGKVFGETSGIGSTLGALAGSFIPIPFLGTAIGSFLGTGLESLIGNKQPTDKTGTALLDLASGGVEIGGLTGKKFSQENRDAAGQIASQFAAFAQSIGGSSGKLDIGVGNRDGLRLDGKDYGDDLDGFLDAGFAKIIDGANNLDPALQRLIRNFNGSADEISAFAGAVLSLSEAAKVNAVDSAVSAWETLTDNQRTATSVYFEQSQALQGMIANFDGSAQSAQVLNSALLASKESAFALASAVLQTSSQIDSLSQNSAKFIRQSVLSEAELKAARQEESRTLLSSLRTLSDPEAIRATFAEFERLNTLIFQSLSPERQVDVAEQFARGIEQANTIAQRRLDESLAAVRDQEQATNDEINQLLTTGAQQMNDAAGRFAATTERFGEYVERLIQSGARIGELGV